MENNKAMKAILEIMGKVKGVGNDITIEGSTMKYNAVSESAVLSALRPLLIDHGLIYYPTSGNLSVSGSVSFVSLTSRIVHVESGDYIEIFSVGGGKDSQDKGPGKAMTYATKYGLLKTFMIRGEDDPDLTSSEELDRIEKEKSILRDQANEILERTFKAGTIGKPERNHISENINDAFNDRDALNRLGKAIAWLNKVESKDIEFVLSTTPEVPAPKGS